MSLKSIDDSYPQSLSSSMDSVELEAAAVKKPLEAAGPGAGEESETHPAHQPNLDQNVRRSMLRSALLNLYGDKVESTDSQKMMQEEAPNKLRRERLVAIGTGDRQLGQGEC